MKGNTFKGKVKDTWNIWKPSADYGSDNPSRGQPSDQPSITNFAGKVTDKVKDSWSKWSLWKPKPQAGQPNPQTNQPTNSMLQPTGQIANEQQPQMSGPEESQLQDDQPRFDSPQTSQPPMNQGENPSMSQPQEQMPQSGQPNALIQPEGQELNHPNQPIQQPQDPQSFPLGGSFPQEQPMNLPSSQPEEQFPGQNFPYPNNQLPVQSGLQEQQPFPMPLDQQSPFQPDRRMMPEQPMSPQEPIFPQQPIFPPEPTFSQQPMSPQEPMFPSQQGMEDPTSNNRAGQPMFPVADQNLPSQFPQTPFNPQEQPPFFGQPMAPDQSMVSPPMANDPRMSNPMANQPTTNGEGPRNEPCPNGMPQQGSKYWIVKKLSLTFFKYFLIRWRSDDGTTSWTKWTDSGHEFSSVSNHGKSDEEKWSNEQSE